MQNFTFACVIILLAISIQESFGVLEQIRCRYYESAGEGYTCELFITNPNSWDNFTSIEGEHIGWNRNGDVTAIRRNAASFTRNIPSIICNTFRNLIFFYYGGDFIREIGENSFSSCMRLTNLLLSNNEIETIHPNAFRQNIRMTWVIMDRNYIRDLANDLFSSTALQIINLDRNLIQVLHSDTFGILRSFSALAVNDNLISAVDERLLNSTSIFSIEFLRNICANVYVINSSPNRDQIRADFRTCFNNYRDRYQRIE